MRGPIVRHWETVALLAVAVLCAFSISALDHQSAPTVGGGRTAMAGLTAAGVEKAVNALDPSAKSSPFVSSGRRSVSYRLDLAGVTDGGITISSRLSDGAVTSVSCDAASTPTHALTAAGNAALHFCATLPVTGAASDTTAWIDQQFATATVGFSQSLNHNGCRYELSYSQYDNDRTHYEVTVVPR